MNRSDAEKLISDCIAELKEEFDELDSIALHNQEKVLDAFRKNAVQARHFGGSTGYGYDDAGRDTLACVFADALGAESAVVSPMITAGTQALSLMLFGVLRPGDLFISVSGKPYDTLTDVISGENCGSLKEFGVDFDVIDLEIHPESPWNGRRLKDLALPEDIVVSSMVRNGKIMSPRGNTMIQDKDILFLMGTPERIHEAASSGGAEIPSEKESDPELHGENPEAENTGSPEGGPDGADSSTQTD